MMSAMVHETIWFERPKYEEAEGHYQRYLAGTISRPMSHVPESSVEKEKPEESKPAKASSFSPVEEIAKARKKIQQTLSMAPTTAASGGDQQITQLEEETKQLKQVTEELRAALQKLTARVELLEQGNRTQPTSQASAPQKKEKTVVQKDGGDDDDDDFDLFGSDDEDEQEENDGRKAALDAYAAKKAKKPAVIAKSNIILDVKPWDDETDLKALENCVRSIECDGLLWGASKFLPVAYGIQKLQICCVVEDEKVGTDLLEEKITEFEDYVQSVDVVAFNKI